MSKAKEAPKDLNAAAVKVMKNLFGEVERLEHTALSRALKLGGLLLNAKDALRTVQKAAWEKWVRHQFGEARMRSARRWMLLAKMGREGKLEGATSIQDAEARCSKHKQQNVVNGVADPVPDVGIQSLEGEEYDVFVRGLRNGAASMPVLNVSGSPEQIEKKAVAAVRKFGEDLRRNTVTVVVVRNNA